MQQIVLKINFFFNDASQNSNELSGHFYLKKKVKKVKINKVDYELDRSSIIEPLYSIRKSTLAGNLPGQVKVEISNWCKKLQYFVS